MKTLLILGLLFRLIISVQIYSGDVNNHVSWGQDILKYGPSGVYQRDFVKPYGTMTPTYPPITLLAFTASKAAFDWSYKTVWNLNLKYSIFPSNLIYFFQDQDTQPAFFKIWAITADIFIAYFVFRITRSYLCMCLILFNPAFFYNSAYWGQLEALPLVFIVAGLYFKNRLSSAVMFTLAILSKQSSIIFLPVLLLPFLKKLTPSVILIPLLIFWFSFFPFFKTGNIFFFPITTYINKIQTGSGSDYVTDHAFNFWALTTGLGKIHDITPYWFGLTYQFWGYLFFGIVICLVLSKKPISLERTYPALAIIGLAAFLFLTRMHSRYIQACLPFLLLDAHFRPRMFFPFIYLSGFYFLNLYHNWYAPRIISLDNFINPIQNINLLIVGAIICFVYIMLDYLRK